MFGLSGLFAATTTTIREGRAALPDFVFGVLADGECRVAARKVGNWGVEGKGTHADTAVLATRVGYFQPVKVDGTTPSYRSKRPNHGGLDVSGFQRIC